MRKRWKFGEGFLEIPKVVFRHNFTPREKKYLNVPFRHPTSVSPLSLPAGKFIFESKAKFSATGNATVIASKTQERTTLTRRKFLCGKEKPVETPTPSPRPCMHTLSLSLQPSPVDSSAKSPSSGHVAGFLVDRDMLLVPALQELQRARQAASHWFLVF